MSDQDLNNLKSMRDVFDYCTKHNLHSVAQGMIELPPPQKLREIASAALLDPKQQNIHQYRNRFGEPTFVSSLRHLLQRHYNVNVSNENILAIAGVTGGIVGSLLMLRHKGKNRVALIEPFYTYHSRQSEEVFSKLPDTIPSNPKDFSPNFEAIESKMKSGVDAIIFCNPGNPSGRCWTESEIEKIVALAKQYNTVLIIDEIYCDMIFEEHKHYSPINKELSDHVIVCRGFSKTLAVQSWRVGYVVSSAKNVIDIMTHHDPIYISVPWMQHSLAEYLDKEYAGFAKHIVEINSMLRANWKLLAPAFKSALGWEPVEPSGSMYGMFRHHEVSDIAALKKGLGKGVGVAPATMFYGAEVGENTGYIRIHVGMSTAKAKDIADALMKKAGSQ